MSADEWINGVPYPSVEYYSTLEKGRGADTGQDPGGNHTKACQVEEVSGTKPHRLYDSIYTVTSRRGTFTETKWVTDSQSLGRGVNGDVC